MIHTRALVKSHFSPVIIHVPHSSTFIPSDEWHRFLPDKLADEIIRMTDHYCDDLFKCSHEMITAPVSRLVCDTERFRDDSLESMAAKGMGVVYTRCSDENNLKFPSSLTPEYTEYIKTKYYDTHHRLLTNAVSKRLDAFDYCIIIDAHSFYPEPLPYEYDQNPGRPDICIGTDEYHTPDVLSRMAVDFFESERLSTAINSPFSGSIVPLNYYKKDLRVISLMVEINRKLYIDKKARQTDNYGRMQQIISSFISAVSSIDFA